MEILLELSVSRFEELLQNETKLNIIKNYIIKSKYISKEDLLILLGIDEEQGEE